MPLRGLRHRRRHRAAIRRKHAAKPERRLRCAARQSKNAAVSYLVLARRISLPVLRRPRGPRTRRPHAGERDRAEPRGARLPLHGGPRGGKDDERAPPREVPELSRRGRQGHRPDGHRRARGARRARRSPRGRTWTSRRSTARATTASMKCGGSRRGIAFRPARDRSKIYIVDEVHMLSNAAWNAFLKTLEEPPPHVVFIFATTEVHKVPVTILSRCQRYDFKLIATQTIATRLREVLALEKIEAEDAAVAVLAREAAGSMRDAMSLLDQVIAYGGGKLTAEDVARVLGVADRAILHELASALVAGDAAGTLRVVDRVAEQGFDLGHVAKDILGHLRNLVVAKVCGEGADRELLDLADEEVGDVRALATKADADDLQRLFQGFSRSFDEIVRSGQPRTALEMALVRLARRPPLLPLDELLARLGDLERRLAGGAGPPVQGGSGGGPPGRGGGGEPTRPKGSAGRGAGGARSDVCAPRPRRPRPRPPSAATPFAPPSAATPPRAPSLGDPHTPAHSGSPATRDSRWPSPNRAPALARSTRRPVEPSRPRLPPSPPRRPPRRRLPACRAGRRPRAASAPRASGQPRRLARDPRARAGRQGARRRDLRTRNPAGGDAAAGPRRVPSAVVRRGAGLGAGGDGPPSARGAGHFSTPTPRWPSISRRGRGRRSRRSTRPTAKPSSQRPTRRRKPIPSFKSHGALRRRATRSPPPRRRRLRRSRCERRPASATGRREGPWRCRSVAV